MTDDTYRDDDEKEEKKEKKDEKKDEKKSVVFKATSSKGKAKQKSSSEDEDLSFDEMDDEKTALKGSRCPRGGVNWANSKFLCNN